MTFTVEWANEEKTIVLTTFQAGWTLKEFMSESSIQEIALLDSVDHPVYLVQVLEGQLPKLSFGWTGNAEGDSALNHPNLAMIVFVAQQRLAPSLINVFSRVFPKHANTLHIEATTEAALAYIASQADISMPT